MSAIEIQESNGQAVTVLNASEPELLMMALRYLESVKAHPRMLEAVRRACVRLLESNKE